MSNEQFEREKNYQIIMSIARTIQARGIPMSDGFGLIDATPRKNTGCFGRFIYLITLDFMPFLSDI